MFQFMHPCIVSNAIMPIELPQSCNRRNFNITMYRAINFGVFYGYPNPIPPEIRKGLPKFSGEKSESAEKHLQRFIELIEDYEVDHEDVIIRLFVQSLTDEAREWFSNLFP